MLSEIETRDELAYLLNVKHSVLTYVLYIAKPSSYYNYKPFPVQQTKAAVCNYSTRENPILYIRAEAFTVSALSLFLMKAIAVRNRFRSGQGRSRRIPKSGVRAKRTVDRSELFGMARSVLS